MRHVLICCSVVILSASVLTGLSGCVKDSPFAGIFAPSNSGEPNPDLQAVVRVEDPDYGGEVLVTVIMSSKSYQDAVGKLRTQEWNEAIDMFNAKIEKESKRERKAEAHFAVGVAYEAQGMYAGALDAYKAALELASGAEYEDAVKRARSGLNK